MRVGGGEGNLRLVRRQGETAGRGGVLQGVRRRAAAPGRPGGGLELGCGGCRPGRRAAAQEELRPAPIAARCLS